MPGNTPDVRATQTVRPAAAAGRFYPAAAKALAQRVDQLLAVAPPSSLAGVHALLAPHAGYACSGKVAAAAYRLLDTQDPPPRTVFLLGPAHYVDVAGVGLPSAAAFATPLGNVAVEQAIVARLLARDAAFALTDAAHAPEHGLEVQLPFLQRLLPTLTIVPMLLRTAAAVRPLADCLVDCLRADPTALVIVSSDLSHYRSYAAAYAADRALLAAVADGDSAAVAAGEACGLSALLALMQVAHTLGWHAHLLAYLNSGDTCSARDQVVGYGAVAWTA